jgi:hypothetical protein
VTVSPESGVTPEIAVQADLEVPERHINITWTLRRDTGAEASASHTMEIKFNLPADFPGGIANVPGILMKQSEQTRGTALTGVCDRSRSAAQYSAAQGKLVDRHPDHLHGRSPQHPGDRKRAVR